MQPLSGHKIFASDQADEIQDALASFYSETKIRIQPVKHEGRVTHELYGVSVGGIMLDSLHWPLGVKGVAPQLEQTYDFCSAYDGVGEIRVGDESVNFDESCGCILSPHLPFQVRAGEDSVHLNVKVPKSNIEAQLRALTGEEIREPLEFQPAMKMGDEPIAGVWRLIRFIVNEIEREQSLLSNVLVGERFSETVLTELLYAQPSNYSHLLRRAPLPAEPHYIQRIEEYIEAHCDQPITSEELATMAGVGMSALYAGFQRHRGYTPLVFLKQMRLRRVRDELLTARPGITVKEVAMRWSFTHMGRFSRDYANSIGELPSETLARSGYRDV